MSSKSKQLLAIMAVVSTMGCQNVYAAQAIQSQDDIVAERFEQTTEEKVLEVPEDNSVVAADRQQTILVSKVKLQDVNLTGYQRNEIDRLLSKYTNRKMTLTELRGVVTEVNAYFRESGYPAATAYLPAQSSKDNEITINVELGKYGKIVLENESSLKDSTINRLLSGMKQGETVNGRVLETAIYNINDLGGVQAAGFFRPGENIGETDIVIRVKDTKKSTFSAYVENYGSVSSGRYRYNLAGSWNNLMGAGERLSINGMTTNQKQHNYGVQYEQLVAKNGTKMAISVGRSDYELGSTYSAMGATGTSSNLGISFSTPLWKTGKSRMSINYGWTYRNLKDEMRDFAYVIEKHSHSAFVGINGAESFGRTALNYDVTATTGTIVADKAEVMGVPLTVASEGRYTKGVLNLSMQYKLNESLYFMFRGQAQKASNYLDSSEQFYLGGARGVRAYPQGEGSGDEGAQATAELVYNTKVKGLSFSTFYDVGHVKYAKDNSIKGNITLEGWGIGASYSKVGYWARIDYARRIGLAENASEAAKARQRIWFSVGIQW